MNCERILTVFGDVVCPQAKDAAYRDMMCPNYQDVVVRYGLETLTLEVVVAEGAFNIQEIRTIGDFNQLLLACSPEGLRFFLPLFAYYFMAYPVPSDECDAEVSLCIGGFLEIASLDKSLSSHSFRKAFADDELKFLFCFFDFFFQSIPEHWKLHRRLTDSVNIIKKKTGQNKGPGDRKRI